MSEAMRMRDREAQGGAMPTGPGAGGAGQGRRASSGRIAVIDIARGVALVAMASYHLSFDLSFYGFVSWPVTTGAEWVAYARSIAATFLMLSGFSLVLMTRRGIVPAKILRRVAVVGGAAALVSLGTWAVVPDDVVRFGILHCIAVTTVLGLVFVRLPPLATLAAAIVVFAIPQFARTPALDSVWLVWLGLAADPPSSMDYVPLLPWFSAVLVGIAAGRFALDRDLLRGLARIEPRSHLLRGLGFAGRHSLPVYLIHQPVFFALIELSLLFGATPAVRVSDYRSSCMESCSATGAGEASCTTYCGCTADGFGRADLWSNFAAARPGTSEQSVVDAIVRECRMRALVPAGQ